MAQIGYCDFLSIVKKHRDDLFKAAKAQAKTLVSHHASALRDQSLVRCKVIHETARRRTDIDLRSICARGAQSGVRRGWSAPPHGDDRCSVG